MVFLHYSRCLRIILCFLVLYQAPMTHASRRGLDMAVNANVRVQETGDGFLRQNAPDQPSAWAPSRITGPDLPSFGELLEKAVQNQENAGPEPVITQGEPGVARWPAFPERFYQAHDITFTDNVAEIKELAQKFYSEFDYGRWKPGQNSRVDAQFVLYTMAAYSTRPESEQLPVAPSVGNAFIF